MPLAECRPPYTLRAFDLEPAWSARLVAALLGLQLLEPEEEEEAATMVDEGAAAAPAAAAAAAVAAAAAAGLPDRLLIAHTCTRTHFNTRRCLLPGLTTLFP
jgi:hypothetical protein